jgi:sec-independent protein translocase protein TatC
MFYVKEIFFRSQYFFLSSILTVFVCSWYKNVLMFLLTYNILSSNSGSKLSGVDYIIYTHPSELFTIYTTIILYLAGALSFLQILWSSLDFLKSSLTIKEYLHLLKFFRFLSLSMCFSNLVCLSILFPRFWVFLESFNNSTILGKDIHLFLELRIQDYFLFLGDFLYLMNIFSFFFFCVCFSFKFYELKRLLRWKKFFIVTNIMFATFLSPPDLYSQISILMTLTILLELVVHSFAFTYKVHKFAKLVYYHKKCSLGFTGYKKYCINFQNF